jgi:hypothetical protein
MQSQMKAKFASMNLTQVTQTQVQHTQLPFCPTFNTSTANRQWLAFDSSSSFPSPDSANIFANLSDTAALLTQQRAKLN